MHASLVAYIDRQRRPAYCMLFSMGDLAGLRANAIREQDGALSERYEELAQNLRGEYRQMEPDPTRLLCPDGPNESWLQ